MRNPDNPNLIERGWVALEDANEFDPIFDLLTQWETKQSAVEQGKEHLEDFGASNVESFFVAQVFHEPILGIEACRTSLIMLKNVEKIKV